MQSYLDPILSKSTRDLMISAINLLEIKFSGRVKVPVVDSYQFQALKDQFVIERIVPTPNFDKYVKMHRSELLELPEFEICLNHFLQTAKIQNHLQTISSNRRINQDDINSYFENNFIFALLTKLIISVGCFKFEEQVFESNYVEMERYLFSDCISFTAIVPLRNFESSVENIEFTNEIRISQISNAELTTLLTSNLVHFSKPNCLDAPVLAIKTSFTIQKSDLNHLKIPLDVVEKVVKSLRISKKGALWYDFIYCISNSWERIDPMRILINPTNFGPTYFLDNNSVSTVVQIWKNLNSIGSQDKFIETAIERFNFAFSRKRTEDKLTDFITSLEALLLSADEKSELEYRLSLRLASLIGVNANEKTLVRKILKSAYIQRSCIVHGKKVKIAQVDGKKYSTEDLSVLMEDYTRKTVRIFMTLINKGVNQEDFLDKLDDGILTAENILTVFKISIDGE